MASNSRFLFLGPLALGLFFAVGGCSHDPRRFRLASPVTVDQDLDPVAITCRADVAERKKGKKDAMTCAPDDYESSFSWDAADNTLFRPISKFFQANAVGEAANVNAFDETPDSSWFVNRIGVNPMTPEEAARGFCPYGPELEANPKDKAWTIDYGKDNGANPGFRVNVGGQKFMFKTDDTQPERATAATAIASRFYFAAGWWAPCDAVVYFKREALVLKPGLTVKANVGPPHKFDEAALTKTLEKTGRRGELYRATASRFIPGKPLGPFTYEGRRDDDPSDVIPHENRRDLRGARVIAAWLNHFDSREQNTMSTWMQVDAKDPKSKGHVRHWYIDLGDCFGSEWDVDGFSRRHGHAYILDIGYMFEDFATLGIIPRPWDSSYRTPGAEIFGYFKAYDFDPDVWRGEYPNPAFNRMTEHDAAWGARIIARFTPEHIAATVKIGDFTNVAHEKWLTEVLIERRRILLKRYFSKLSPLADVSIVENGRLCAVDLAKRTNVLGGFSYSAKVTRGASSDKTSVGVEVGEGGNVCVQLASNGNIAANVPNNAPERYVVVSVTNGTGSGPIDIHLYDQGARGFVVVGIERRS